MASCTCTFSYKAEARRWLACVHGLSHLRPCNYAAQPAWRCTCSASLFWRRAATCVTEAWRGDIERQQDTSILCSPTGARALPAPAWRRAGRGCRICASPRKRTRFPTSNFFSCLHLLIRFCTSYCKAVLTVTPAPMLTSTSAGNRPQVFYLSAGRGVINYQFSHKKKKKLKQSAKRTPQIAGQK